MLSVGDYICIRQNACAPWEVAQIMKFWPNGYVSVRWVEKKGCAQGVIIMGKYI